MLCVFEGLDVRAGGWVGRAPMVGGSQVVYSCRRVKCACLVVYSLSCKVMLLDWTGHAYEAHMLLFLLSCLLCCPASCWCPAGTV
jgi:hypothetical protein